MDKEQKPVLKWMIDQSYRPVIFKTIAGLMLLEISKLIEAVYKAEYIPDSDKSMFISDMMIKDTTKRKFDHAINDLSTREVEVIAEIMKQHSLMDGLPLDEVTLYHDEMVVVFREELSKVRTYIETNEYHKLYKG